MVLRTHFPALLRNALDTAAHGWPVFLLGRTKRPLANCQPCKEAGTGHNPETCPCLTCHGFYAATLDPDRIHAMCTAHPGGLLAIRTGTIADLAVLDIDPRNGGTINPNLMPPTWCVATGGGGWHLYYRHPGGTLSSTLNGHPGIDIKADGGYVVAPPSVHPVSRRPYLRVGDHSVNEMAPALITACRPRPAVTVTAPTRPITTTGGGAISNPDALLSAILGSVARAPKGQHRKTLYGAARGVARMVAAGALTSTDAVNALTDAGRDARQTDREIREAIKGGFRAEGITA